MTADQAHGVAKIAVARGLHTQPAEELAAAAGTGCTAAFAELFRRYQPRLTRFLRKRLGSLVDAEDVTQDSLAKAWQAMATFDTRCRFTTWLYTIAVRSAIDHQRRRHIGQSTTRLEMVVDVAEAVEHQTLRRDEATNLWATANRVLSEDQYSALWLRYGEDLSIKEVAQVLKKTSVGVRVVLHRARSELKPHLNASNEVGLGYGEPSDDSVNGRPAERGGER